MSETLQIRYEGRPRPWARPTTFPLMRKGKPILDAKGRPRFVRAEAKDRHWSRTAFNAMVKLWNEAWLARSEGRGSWYPDQPMSLYVRAHFDGREGGYLQAELAPIGSVAEIDVGDHVYASAPDADNVGKLVAEAAQKAGVVKNDSQIVVLVVLKTKEEK